MKRLIASTLVLALTLALSPMVASAATGVGERECLLDIARAMGREQRIYRAVLFGRTRASDAPIGEVRYTEDGIMYAKRGQNSWQPSLGGPLGSGEMDAQQEKDVLCETGAASCVRTPHKGVFTVRGSMTSDAEILPAILQAQRALTYRALTVCDAAVQSMSPKVSNPVPAKIIGGVMVPMKPFLGCAFGGSDEWQAARLTVTERCREIADSMITSERQLLQLLVAYDSGVRSLYQFSGGFDAFLASWKSTLMGPLWQLTRMMRWLPKIPCFLSTCSE